MLGNSGGPKAERRIGRVEGERLELERYRTVSRRDSGGRESGEALSRPDGAVVEAIREGGVVDRSRFRRQPCNERMKTWGKVS